MSKLDDLSAWRLFCSLCNTRNFSDTAGEFDVEVSTVSRALTSLENALGQTLILRVTRPLQLTESGKIAYEHASNILLQHEEMVKELTQSSAGMAGKIRLSLAPGSVAVYIPMLMNLTPSTLRLSLTSSEAEIFRTFFSTKPTFPSQALNQKTRGLCRSPADAMYTFRSPLGTT